MGSLLLEAVMSAGSSVDGSTPEAMACAAAAFLAARVALRLATAAAMEPLAHRAVEKGQSICFSRQGNNITENILFMEWLIFSLFVICR